MIENTVFWSLFRDCIPEIPVGILKDSQLRFSQDWMVNFAVRLQQHIVSITDSMKLSSIPGDTCEHEREKLERERERDL